MKKVLRLCIFIFILAFLASYLLGEIEVKYKDIIDAEAEKNSLDKSLVYALIMAESKFEPDALSSKGAMGLMQITEDTALWCAEKMGNSAIAADITVPEVNISIGCFYLRYLMDRFDNSESAALAAYNAGSGNVDAWLTDSSYSPDGKNITSAPYPETDKYIKKIAFYKKMYTLLYGE